MALGGAGWGVAGGDEPRSKERLRAGLNGSEWVGRSYVFYPVTPSTSGRCRGGKERPARPPRASSHESHVLDNALAAAKCSPRQPRAPGVCGCGLLSPKEGVAAQLEFYPAGWGARKLEGTGELGGGSNVGEPAPGK